MQRTVTLIPGDGIGPEVMASARKVLDATRRTHLAFKGPATTLHWRRLPQCQRRVAQGA